MVSKDKAWFVARFQIWWTFTHLPLQHRLMFTNLWNLYKGKRLKVEPLLCPFAQLGIYFTTSIEPLVSGWWRAKAGPNFVPNYPQIPQTHAAVASLWQACLSCLLSAKSELAFGWIAPLLLCVALSEGIMGQNRTQSSMPNTSRINQKNLTFRVVGV